MYERDFGIGETVTYKPGEGKAERTGVFLMELEPLEVLGRVIDKLRPGTKRARLKSPPVSEDRRYLFEVGTDYYAVVARLFIRVRATA